MDYKYIEQLLERYWECNTTLEEEQMLRFFFNQKDIPAHLECYKSLFKMQTEERQKQLGNDFDEKMLNLINEKEVVATRNSFTLRLRPFYRAAAIVAIIFTISLALQETFTATQTNDSQTQAEYINAYSSPQAAFEQVAQSQITDSTSAPVDSMTLIQEN